MTFCDIWACECVLGNFFVDFGCLGCPWGDFGHPVSISNRFFVVWGVRNGSLWDLKCLSAAFLTAFL